MNHRLRLVNQKPIGDCVPFKDRNRLLYDELAAKRLRRGFYIFIIGICLLCGFEILTAIDVPNQTVEVSR